MPLLTLNEISKEGRLRNVSLSIEPGEVVGLIGESGSGKSTLARIAAGLEHPSSGSIELGFEGERALQMVFQQPHTSLNPRMRIIDAVAEGLDIHRLAKGHERRARAAHLLRLVALREDLLDLYPHQLSGGQQQRVAIARALAVDPKLIILDEPVSALDLSVQAQVVGLLRNLREQMGLSYLFISHDLPLVRHLCHRVAVLYQGELVEIAPTQELFERPKHPYTAELLSIPH